jgi:hypothetical protein
MTRFAFRISLIILMDLLDIGQPIPSPSHFQTAARGGTVALVRPSRATLGGRLWLQQLQLCSKLVSGHGFSHAIKNIKSNWL